MAAALPPHPRYLRASAQDAGNMSLRRAGRTAWSQEDAERAAATLHRLISGCYGEGDAGIIAFMAAERAERERRS